MAAWTLRKKKQQQSGVFFDVIFDVYTQADNRERARASDWKQKRRIFSKKKMKIQSGGKTMRNFSGVRWKWGAVKNKSYMSTGDKILDKYVRQFLHKNNA